MENRMKVCLYKPHPEDLWFCEVVPADREPGDSSGTPGNRDFYRLVVTGKSRAVVGEASWHYDDSRQIRLAEIRIMDRCRGQGYGSEALELLCAAARKAGIRELYHEAAAGDPGAGWYLRRGFREEGGTEGTVLLRKEL